MIKKELIEYINVNSNKIIRSRKRNRYYYSQIKKLLVFNIPENSKVLEVGCANGELLAAVNPSFGVGIDISSNLLKEAGKNCSHLHFICCDAEELPVRHKFDYIIISNLLGFLEDIQKFFSMLKSVSLPHTKIIVLHFNYAWFPVLRLAEITGQKFKDIQHQNWIAKDDIINLMHLSDIDTIKQNLFVLFPRYFPLLSAFLNRFLVKLPLIRNLGLLTLIVSRFEPYVFDAPPDYSVSIIVPARNEKGHIQEIISRIPKMGLGTEVVFVEGNSSDGTYEEIERCVKEYKGELSLKLISQGDGKGKGDAVRKGFKIASGDILMILDADITVPPEDTPRFYKAIKNGRGEFINGSRLVYPLEEKAMRFLNILGNKFFSWVFTYILNQRFKDTLCGTKVILKKDYKKIEANRHYFGDFDPFGDFDLIFGAAKLNLKIVEIPIHYKARRYGDTNISRFSHGFLLIKMSLFAFKRFKLI